MEREEFCNYISSLCIKSILYELAASPKPGLVDRFNSGAHRDMDVFTFLASTSVLFPYFQECTRAGLDFQGEDYTNLMYALRPIGIKAEDLMFQETDGINTHKGAIFSLGILAASVGTLFKKDESNYFTIEKVIDRVKRLTRGITNELEGSYKKKSLTYGEKLYLSYGVKGIRGEVESGFYTVIRYSLPIFMELMEFNKYKINDILVHTLIHLIAYTEDSNILGRHNLEILKYSQEKAKEALKVGGYLTREGKLMVEVMDKDFIGKNISPGGAADLLSVTLLMYFLQKQKQK